MYTIKDIDISGKISTVQFNRIAINALNNTMRVIFKKDQFWLVVYTDNDSLRPVFMDLVNQLLLADGGWQKSLQEIVRYNSERLSDSVETLQYVITDATDLRFGSVLDNVNITSTKLIHKHVYKGERPAVFLRYGFELNNSVVFHTTELWYETLHKMGGVRLPQEYIEYYLRNKQYVKSYTDFLDSIACKTKLSYQKEYEQLVKQVNRFDKLFLPYWEQLVSEFNCSNIET